MTLSTDEAVECDCYIPTGTTGGTGGSFMPADAVDDKGYIKVGPTLQVKVVDTLYILLASFVTTAAILPGSSDHICDWRLVTHSICFFVLPPMSNNPVFFSTSIK